ncbi:fused MFS/spermidine synthase [Actinoplanes sp. HUAS TT8]|uniref:fused MFS/spermidine synthase n=1 Tax=Actinoplanes sp. HUAS TT8 TaxID=3447453 RepID=UPI003F5242BA
MPLPGWLGGLLVFLSGAVVLALEIVGMRLIAPYTGVTLETSTGVITVALAAIAGGAWAGGRLADRKGAQSLLPVILLAAAATTALTVPAVRRLGPHLGGAGTPGVLLMAAATLLAPAALLSTVSPIVARLRITDLSRSGSVVGRLSGLGTLGSVSASLLTGFVLVAALPSSGIVWFLAGLLAVAGAGLGLRRTIRRARLGATVLVVVALGTAVAVARSAPSPCEVETAYECASVVADASHPGGRTLVLNAESHSYVDVADPRYLKFGYTRMIAAAVDAVPAPAGPLDVLHLGGGALTLPGYVAATRAGSRQRVVEIDAALLDLVRERFPQPAGTTYATQDARVAVGASPAASQDVVIGDAFSQVAVPWHLTTAEFVTGVRRVLRPGGTYVLNLIDGPGGALARAEAATLCQVFGDVVILGDPAVLRGERAGNFVMLASDATVPVTRLRAALSAHGATGIGVVRGDRFAGPARVLTDDYAPVDQLIDVP